MIPSAPAYPCIPKPPADPFCPGSDKPADPRLPTGDQKRPVTPKA
jgi:hypothetical protein